MDALVPGSVAALARDSYRGSLARAWVGVDVVILADISGSMGELIDGQPAIAYARRAVADIQARHPGRVALIAYNERATLLPGGALPDPSGNTLLAPALQLAAQLAAPDVKLIVISDGLWRDHALVMHIASTLPNAIDGVYVGSDPAGKRALQQLCAGRGQALMKRVPELAETITRLLPGA